MQNIFKSTYRNFVRKPATNLINLVGLAVSLALVITLSVYSYSELTTDNYHKNGKRVFLYSDVNNLPRIYTPGVLKDNIDLSVPGVESTVRIAGTWEAPVFQVAGKDPITSDLIFADEDFFKLFTYKVVEGNPELALKEPMTVVITQSLSEKLFGKETAVGKNLKLNNENELTVKAVIEDPKANSSLSFSALTSIATRKVVMPNEAEFKVWPFCLFQTFVLLKEGTKPDETAKKIAALFPNEMRTKESAAQLTPIKKLHFSQFALFSGNYLHFGDQKKVMVLLLVAALVLIIALVNFINISASQWIERIRQTGVLKVNGASRSNLLFQVISEAFLFFLIALFFAILLIRIFTPYICSYTGIQFNTDLISSPEFLGIAVASTLALSLIFSIIPGLRISSSDAIDNLRRAVELRTKNSISSGILVTSQFAIAIVLIAFTVLVQKQVNFGSSNLGINQDNVIGIRLTPELMGKRDVLKKMLLEKPSVGKISFSQYYPGQPLSYWETKMDAAGEPKQLSYDTFGADAGFFETMGLQLISGRLYSEDLSTDADKVVVNESFARENKLQNPLGVKFFSMNGSVCEIIGVIKDFHYKPVNKPILPLAIRNEPFASYCLLNLQTSDYSALNNTIQDIKKSATGLSPSFPVEISFLDQAIENLYQSELQFRRTFSLFAGCAIVICCLGILAMSLFACQRRIKEIGIRKVNGATISEVMTMLNRDFVKWVLIAFLIATPVAWFVMNKWLESFAYKTELSWWIFALSGVLALGIALLTVSLQSWKAATRNPVEALRYE
ncbi:ABC transporter permease [Aquipluma nitroreducens]|uniref:ABC transporter permease n=1 Tax=Aquipluma nitroreducens TaxID=2010828 RepID=A0A5K7SA00_9BACT|nr:ABC transporter permease [Aquipluma nitroreducens]BBE18408.1 ABC transporter permease [Aquipluma nitroreducens]